MDMGDEKITTKEILKLIAIGGILVGSVVAPNLPMAAGYICKKWKKINQRDLGRIIKRLEKQEMINYSEKDGKTQIEITEKGQKRLLEYNFESMVLGVKKTDGKWRVIIFDIPEYKKKSRDAFSKKLLQLGLTRWQDSVFISAFPCKKEIDFLCHYLEISDFVTLATLDKIERGEKLVFKKYYSED